MKFTIKSQWLLMIITLYFATLLNLSFWRYVIQHIQLIQYQDYLFIITVPLLLSATIYLLFSLTVWPYVAKPLLILLLISAGIAQYVMFQLGVYIDSDMIRNALQTNQREAFDLVTVDGLVWVGIFSVLPSLILLRTKVIYRSFLRECFFRVVTIIIAITIIAMIALISYKEYASFGRNNRQIVRLINPTNYLYATYRYQHKLRLVNKEFSEIDPNASLQPFDDEYPTVLIIVLGETARTMNFSLNGYERETNPELTKHGVISFQNVSSCGTATAISVPCMFSDMPRKAYDPDQVAYRDNILDLLQNSGYTLLWRENDDGCKGVCNRIPTEDMVTLNHPRYCDGSVCFDEVLLDGLEDYLKNIIGDTVIVLHTIGSHGPTYYKRYPEHFKNFTPTCDTAEIQNCSTEAIINTYDNTIRYTDYIVSGAIDILKKFPRYESGLLYISDHGESLGENGLYLHGVPYKIAPKEQTQVPLILWLSSTMAKEDHIDVPCLNKLAKNQFFSHDNLFHSLLALLEVQSKAYDSSLDLFAPCRTKELPWNTEAIQ